MRHYQLERLDKPTLATLIARESSDLAEALSTARGILENVEANRDQAVFEYSKRFDGVNLESISVSEQEIEASRHRLSRNLKQALEAAAANIEAFHKLQIPTPIDFNPTRGVSCRLEWRAIDRVGIYVPGGSAPLVSTVLMLGLPARLAGCAEVIMCTPPSKTGVVPDEIIYAAALCGVRKIFKIGGAQAIAAMGLGTETVPKVQKVFGPGNQYVAAAKSIISKPPYDVAIDMLAGPSELVIIADESANPRWVASDLLSQAEHGPDSQVVLVTTSREVAASVDNELERQLSGLPRRHALTQALRNSFTVIAAGITNAIEFVNGYAPEHLIINVSEAERVAGEVRNAGSVFLGPFSSVVFGDYASGANHTLPTGGTAVASGILTVQSFMKPVAFQTITSDGLRYLGDVVKRLARAEGLEAHARAVETREESL